MENKVTPHLLNWVTGQVKGFQGKLLLERKNGGIKIIKVDALAKYPQHIHPDKTEFAYVLEGLPEIQIGSEKYFGEKDDFFIFPSGITHSIINPTNTECILLIGAFID